MADRNKVVYKFKSPRNPNGRAKHRLEFVPTRDLTVRDVERLSDEEHEAVKSAVMPNGNKLYASVGGRKKKKVDSDAADSDVPDEGEGDEEDADEEEEEAGDDEASEESTLNVGAGLHTIAVSEAPDGDGE